jgi:tyrosyl-tRNA synthetase
MDLTIEQRLALITRGLEETMTTADLVQLLESGEPIRHYIGFEISGKIHLGTGLMCMAKIRDFLDAGVECTILLADWHTWINDKLGGDREAIRAVALNYFQEGMKAALRCYDRDPARIRFVLGTDLYHCNDAYWATVIDVAKNTTLARMQRSITILGRREGESVDFAKLIYPAMQAADIFALGVNLAHAGMDQRKAHVIARDTALRIRSLPLRNARGEQIKPVAVHHPLLLGLRKPPIWPPPEDESLQDFRAAMKMSKSDPASAVFIHDSPEEIRAKIRRAFCPPQEVTFNPVLDWARRLLFNEQGRDLRIERTPENGGPVRFDTWEELAEAYRSGALHPLDLKNGVAEALIELLEPARRIFADAECQRWIAEVERLQGMQSLAGKS